MTPVDEAIMTMVHTMTKNQDLKKNISNILDVEKNPQKAFVLWFSCEVLAIPDRRWQDFKSEAIKLLQLYEQYQPPLGCLHW